MFAVINLVAQLLPTVVALIQQIEPLLPHGPDKKAAVSQTVAQLVAASGLPEAEQETARLAVQNMIDPLVATLNQTQWKRSR
jgi:hypothetical protein